jgi:hypothetical protein
MEYTSLLSARRQSALGSCRHGIHERWSKWSVETTKIKVTAPRDEPTINTIVIDRIQLEEPVNVGISLRFL